jgi:carboxylesterase
MTEPVDASPFDLGPPESTTAALCIHGLSGTPYEVRPVAEALARIGIRARGIALPGHCTSAEDLARTHRSDWVEAAHDALVELRASHDRVVLVGMSMGGVVSLALAQSAPVDAVVTIGAPLYLDGPIRFAVPIAKYLLPMLRKQGGSNIRDAAARARHPGYPVMPLAAVHELIKLQGEVRPGLAGVAAPILVAHGAHDRTANPRNARVIHDGVSSELRELVMFERSAHVVPVDHDGPELAERVTSFVGRAAEHASSRPR